MKNKRSSPPSLSDEDQKIWKEVTRGIKKLPKKLPKPLSTNTKTKDIPAAFSPVADSPSAPLTPPSLSVFKIKKNLAPLTSQKSSPSLISFTPRTQRKLKSYVLPRDSILDLHGQTQDQAFKTLHRFLKKAQAQDRRLVLIITGKGTLSSKTSDPSAKGVLRRHVPYWLSDSSWRSLVLGFQEAPLSQGGKGALYVRIRKKSPSEK